MTLARMKADAETGKALRRRMPFIERRLQMLMRTLWHFDEHEEQAATRRALDAVSYIQQSLRLAAGISPDIDTGERQQ